MKSYKNSFINIFIDELKKPLAILDSIEKLPKPSKDTLFTLDRYKGDYAICENSTNSKMYDIPTFKVHHLLKKEKL